MFSHMMVGSNDIERLEEVLRCVVRRDRAKPGQRDDKGG